MGGSTGMGIPSYSEVVGLLFEGSGFNGWDGTVDQLCDLFVFASLELADENMIIRNREEAEWTAFRRRIFLVRWWLWLSGNTPGTTSMRLAPEILENYILGLGDFERALKSKETALLLGKFALPLDRFPNIVAKCEELQKRLQLQCERMRKAGE